MMSLRSFSRAIPRSIPRLTAQCHPRTLSTISSFRRPSLLQQTYKAISIPRHAAFSTTQAAQEKEGYVDQELSAKIASELEMEREMRDSEKLSSAVSDYLSSSSFELHDTPGEEEVLMTRKFGDETIRVSFSIADLNAMDQTDQEPYDDDTALYDEAASAPENTQSGGAHTKGAINTGHTKGGNINIAPEDRVAPADREELMDDESAAANDDDDAPSFPCHMNVLISKPGNGALQFETTVQDGEIVIQNVFYYPKPELAEAKTAELDHRRRQLYEGPPFANLDEDLQVLLERYLNERGVNNALALWVPEYIDFKEQREYTSWLANMKAFVDA